MISGCSNISFVIENLLEVYSNADICTSFNTVIFSAKRIFTFLQGETKDGDVMEVVLLLC